MTDLNNAIDALLLQPPPGDLTGPYPAMAYLKSRAERDGFQVKAMDLGIDALHYLSHGSRVKELVRLADFFRKKLEARPSLGPEEQRWYALLVRAIGFDLKPGIAREAIRNFQDPEKFYDHFEYKKSCAALDAFYRLLSATHYPSEITPSEYPPARVMGRLENILAHKEREINPFISYYFNELFPAIRKLEPAVVGISMVFGAQSVQGLALAALVKKHFPEVHVTLGGAYFSQWVMQMEDPLLSAILTFSDSIVCGEGEAPFSDLLMRLKNGESLEGSPNLIYRDSSDKGFRKFGTMTYTDVAEQPPPDFSDLDMSKYLAPDLVIPYAISRGCYWGKCAFCQNRYGDHGVRKYQTVPLEKALAEMTELSEKYDTPHFNFSNDVIDPAYVEKFSRAVIDSGKIFYWNTDLRAEKQFTPELCKLMADAGLNCVAIGFESACQKVLDLMDKGNRKETTREVFKNLHDAGAATQAMGFFRFSGGNRVRRGRDGGVSGAEHRPHFLLRDGPSDGRARLPHVRKSAKLRGFRYQLPGKSLKDPRTGLAFQVPHVAHVGQQALSEVEHAGGPVRHRRLPLCRRPFHQPRFSLFQARRTGHLEETQGGGTGTEPQPVPPAGPPHGPPARRPVRRPGRRRGRSPLGPAANFLPATLSGGKNPLGRKRGVGRAAYSRTALRGTRRVGAVGPGKRPVPGRPRRRRLHSQNRWQAEPQLPSFPDPGAQPRTGGHVFCPVRKLRGNGNRLGRRRGGAPLAGGRSGMMKMPSNLDRKIRLLQLSKRQLFIRLMVNGLYFRARKLAAKPTPMKAVTITVTRRCNSRCTMCDIWRLGIKKDELSRKQILDFLSSPIFTELVELDLTGGEPLLRKDLPEIIKRATGPGEHRLKNLKTLALATNGLLPDTIERQVRSLLDAIDGRFDLALVCSLDGFGELHDKIRGVKGAYEKSRETIGKLNGLKKEAPNFRLGIKTTILPKNIHRLPELMAFSADNGFFHIISPVLFTEKRFHNFRRKERLEVVDKYHAELQCLYEGKHFEGSHFARIMRDSIEAGRRREGCSAAMDHVFVEGDGEVYPCPVTPVSMGNIRYDSAESIFHSPKNRAVVRKAGHFKNCRTCFEPGCIRFSQAGEGFSFLKSLLTKNGGKIMRESMIDEGLCKYF